MIGASLSPVWNFEGELKNYKKHVGEVIIVTEARKDAARTKECCRCKETKPLSEFKRGRNGGVWEYCMACEGMSGHNRLEISDVG